MSVTTSFVCDDCKESCWAGQGSYLYGYQYIPDWLHNHRRHRLRFLTENDFDLEDLYHYKENPNEVDKKVTVSDNDV